ncbi:MAG: hypothetical protein ABSF38_03215 [Verrucomicrobiota bacterium]|jgi:hypothetical protein
MSSISNKLAKGSFRVDLDSEITTWPGSSLQSLAAVFVHLEKLAVRQHLTMAAIWENENVAKLHELLSGRQMADSARNGGLSFRELGRQIIETAKAQVRVLETRASEAQSLILINDWPVARRLWNPLQSECRTPLYELNFIEDLWGFDPAQIAANSRHRRQFVLIQADVRMLLARQESLLELSNTLERDLGCWLTHFGKILEKLDEESAC